MQSALTCEIRYLIYKLCTYVKTIVQFMLEQMLSEFCSQLKIWDLGF